MALLRYFVLGIFSLLADVAVGGDPFAVFNWEVSYKTVSPLGVPQQVIAINGQFPGPSIIVTTNWNVVVNVKNKLDEPILFSWDGVQMRRNSWQDGVLGTNCPIPQNWNWTYEFQVKDQIGSFFYFLSTDFQKAAGAFGAFIINNRNVIPLPFAVPDGDFTLLIGDWYTKSHKDMRQDLEDGKDFGLPDGVLMNGFGPYRFNESLIPAGIAYETMNVEPGKTYRLRVLNVGISMSFNFRIQNHNLLLVETEGSYTAQQIYSDMDIHVGQSYSFLVTMDQNASSDYFVVASGRFVNDVDWKRLSSVAILHYSNSLSRASGPLPEPPNDENDKYYSMNQARSIRWNVTASAARPNPQGSFKYGQISVTDVYVLLSGPPEPINGKWRATLNGISYFRPKTPLKLAQHFNVLGVFKLDFPNRMMNRPAKMDTSLINATYRGFMEVILQNNDTIVQAYHLDGYAFFVVGMDYGIWTENSRSTYNKWDGVARSTTQVFPGAWTAVLISVDNVGIWNLRSENLKSWYLGQETYISVVNPEVNDKTELPAPDNVIYCGDLESLQRDQQRKIRFSDARSTSIAFRVVLIAVSISWVILC